MMNKIIYEYKNEYGYLSATSCFLKNQSTLAMVISSLREVNKFISIDKLDDDTIVFWNKYLEDEYNSYEEIPKLIIKTKNYDEIIAAWNINMNKLKPYLVLSQDESGWITLTAKDNLSSDDLAAIDADNKAKKEWEKQWIEQYEKHHSQSRVRLFFEESYEKIKNWFKRLKR